MKRIFAAIAFLGCFYLVNAQTGADSVYKIKINGQVLDASTKQPLEGINVTYGTYTSAFTDSLGNFVLSVPNTKVSLTVSGEGFQPQYLPLRQKESIEVYLHEEYFPSFYQFSNEFYSVKPLIENTKSVSVIADNTESWKDPGISPEEALQDKITGLNVISKSGMPGMGSHMFLRGFSSLYGANNPLIVVDGFVLDNSGVYDSPITGYVSNPLAFIDITDIENITLVKDASTWYGSQAGNGVLFITTQRPNDVVTKITFNVLGGINYAPDQLPVMEANDYRRYLNEILQTSGLSSNSIDELNFMNDDPTSTDYYRYHNNTNWQDEIFTNGIFNKYNLRISGGDDIALYSLSVGYTNNEGVLKNTRFKRYNARFNSDIQVSPKFIINAGINFALDDYTLKEEGLVKTSPVHQSLYKAPFLYPYLRSSTGVVSPILEDVDELGISNPTVIIDNVNATSDNYQMFGLFNANYQLTRDISISDQVGVDFHKTRNNLFVPHLGVAADTLEQGVAENKMAHQVSRYFNLSNDFRINYHHIFNTVHHVTGLAGVRLSSLQSEDDWGQSHNSPNDEMKTINYGTNIFRSIGGDLADLNRLTYYLNGEYNYAQRYLVSLSLTADGASNFGEEAQGMDLYGKKFGIFPAISAAWLISSENFMSDISLVDVLKMRVSYGLAGNSNFAEFPSSKYYVSQNFIGSQGLIKGSLWTPSLQWETVTKINAGLDVSIWQNRASISFDYFQNVTSDMLNMIDADPRSGFSYYIDNDGSFQSKGFEISAFLRPVDTKNFKWDLSLTYSNYQTEVLELPNDNKIITVYGANLLTRVGEPLGLFYGYKTLGVYSTQEQAETDGLFAVLPNTDLSPFGAGDMIFEDLNGDKIIDENDMQIIGDPNPDFIGTISNKFSWKGISLEAVISIVSGNDVFNQLRYQLESMQNTNNQSQAVLNRWKTEGQVTNIPKAYAGDPQGNSRFSDRWIEDGSYVRLKYVTLSYKLPWQPLFIRGLEVFVTGKNLITLTNYLGYDPESSISSFSLAQGIDIGLTPQVKSVYAGIKINF